MGASTPSWNDPRRCLRAPAIASQASDASPRRSEQRNASISPRIWMLSRLRRWVGAFTSSNEALAPRQRRYSFRPPWPTAAGRLRLAPCWHGGDLRRAITGSRNGVTGQPLVEDRADHVSSPDLTSREGGLHLAFASRHRRSVAAEPRCQRRIPMRKETVRFRRCPRPMSGPAQRTQPVRRRRPIIMNMEKARK